MTATSTSLEEKIQALEEVDEHLTSINMSHALPPGTWERSLFAECRTRFTVKAVRAEALLFYSQDANGAPDYKTLHGGCPVMAGVKWAANLCVWNGPRNGYWVFSPLTGEMERPRLGAVGATFMSKDVAGGLLYWEETLWEPLLPNKPVKINTFKGHTWHAKVNGKTLFTWYIDDDKPFQEFIICADDLLELPDQALRIP
ncbi:hypothetical protein B484DRAFT_443202 [Ochromonadaceae sp. CCMP2298]|nr:hypothetical protein B484DRAFT_443202 [Ochromonadaceae sp. CCMP2298]